MLPSAKSGWGDSTLIEPQGYLQRRHQREAWISLKQQIGFGYIVNGFLFIFGGLKAAIVFTLNDPVWLTMMWIGAAGILVTLVFPSAWALPERMFRKLAGLIGHVVFSILLTALYIIFFLPVYLFPIIIVYSYRPIQQISSVILLSILIILLSIY